MKTREKIPGNPANRPHNDALRETSGKLHSAEETLHFRATRRAKNVAFWPRKGKAAFVIAAHRASCKTAEFQRRYTIRMAFTYSPGWKADTSTRGVLSSRASRARISTAHSPKKWTMFQTRIIISHRITREKIYPACFCALRVSFP